MRFRFLFFILLVIVIVPRSVSAASFYFGTDTQTVSDDTVFEVGVFVDTEGELINAVSGDISIPADVSIERVEDGQSLITLWTKRPSVGDGSITYEGIIPGGFSGKDLYLFSFFARASRVGSLSFASTHDRVLLNDGLGTDTSIHEGNLMLTVLSTTGEDVTGEEDRIPPEGFTPVIITDPSLYEGKMTLVFSATDKQSGIDHFEVAEYRAGLAALFSGKNWVPAASPYLLLDQTGRSLVGVRAVDKSGNIREVDVGPYHAINPITSSAIWVVALAILGGILAFFFVRKK
jgi:hypothetical protein